MTATTEQIHVLIVDDDPSFNKYVCRVLEADGYVCHQALNAKEARTVLSRRTVHLLLCDIRMAEESGIDLISGVLAKRNDLAVIMVTGVDLPDFYEQAIELGVYGYLLKPVSRSQLLISVQVALKRLRLEGRLRNQFKKLKAANRQIKTQSQALIEQERLQVLLEFAGAAAHELNSPLSVLLGNIELVTEFECDADQFEVYLDEIKKAGQRIADIVRKIQRVKSYNVKPYAGGERIIDLVASQE